MSWVTTCETETEFQGILNDYYFSSTESLDVEPSIPDTHTIISPSVSNMVQSLLSWSMHYGVSDNGMSALLKLLKASLAVTEHEPQHVPVSEQLPTTLKGALSLLTFSEPPQILELLTCRGCLSVYDEWKKMDPVAHPTCIHVAAPLHIQTSRRIVCGHPLFSTSPGSHRHIPRPILVYPYVPITHTLRSFLLRPGFVELCQVIHRQPVGDDCGLMCDIYDGKMWKEFATVNGQPFLDSTSSSEINIAFQLNVDWFKPFVHTNYSVGGIYLTILNLPRNVRYHLENTLLVGIVPGPTEPRLHMNSFLFPLVAELLDLWNGVHLPISHLNGLQFQVLVRAALISVVCDIPALNKVAGFVGHTALKGCSKCLRNFPTQSFGETPDYSGCIIVKHGQSETTIHTEFMHTSI